MINKLDEKTIKLIVAGEVYVRPTNILKELIDNALDAGSKTIRTTAVDGGYKSIVVTDDGCGIRYLDRLKLCKRFCTSKIRTHAELQDLSTFGFRGEALALLSHTADLVISSRHLSEEIGWTCQFHDGDIVSDVQTARDVGSTVTATNIFRRHSLRRQQGNEVGQEKAALAALVTDLAVHFADVSFALMAGENESLLATHAQPDRGLQARQAQIKKLYGSRIANHLVLVSTQTDILRVEALMSPLQGADTPAAKMIANFTCFVNDRLVNWSSLRRAVRLLYQESSPKDRLVFVHLDVHMPQGLIDPNVDPSKSLFVCKDEMQVVQWIADGLRSQQEARHNPVDSDVATGPRRKSATRAKLTSDDLCDWLATFDDVPIHVLKASEMIGSITCGVYLIAIEDQLVIVDLRAVLSLMLDEEISAGTGCLKGSIYDCAKLSPPLTLEALRALVESQEVFDVIKERLKSPTLAPLMGERDGNGIVYIPYIVEMPSMVEVMEAIEHSRFQSLSLGAFMIAVSSRRHSSKMKQSCDERVWHHILTRLPKCETGGGDGKPWTVAKNTDAEFEAEPSPGKCVTARVLVGLQSLLGAFERC